MPYLNYTLQTAVTHLTTGSIAEYTTTSSETLPTFVGTDYNPTGGGSSETLPSFAGTDYAVTGTITHDVVLATTGMLNGSHIWKHNVLTTTGLMLGAHILRNFAACPTIGAFQRPLILAGMLDIGVMPSGTY